MPVTFGYALKNMVQTDKAARIAAANAIMVLVQAGVQFTGADLRGIKVPGADLSYGMFDTANFEGADLRKTDLRSVRLRQAKLSGAQVGGVQFGELPCLREDSAVQSCAYSPNGKTYVVGLWNGGISLYDTANRNRLWVLKGHRDKVTNLAYSPQDQIASGSDDSTVRLWDAETRNYVHTLQGHNFSVNSVVCSPKGGQIASEDFNKAARLWDVETGECLVLIKGFGGGIESVS